jgi:hypothetical protein
MRYKLVHIKESLSTPVAIIASFNMVLYNAPLATNGHTKKGSHGSRHVMIKELW